MNRRIRKRLIYAATTLLIAVLTAAAATIYNHADERPASGEAPTAEEASVVRVVDGDTLLVLIDGEADAQRVRLIGINTPELGHGKGHDDCYAVEATHELEHLTPEGARVTLRSDPTQSLTDRYGRLVRHVDVGGMSVVQSLLEAGAGPEYTYNRPYEGQAAYRAAESEARAAGAGYWGACR